MKTSCRRSGADPETWRDADCVRRQHAVARNGFAVDGPTNYRGCVVSWRGVLIFADLALARRIDGAEATLSGDIAGAILARGGVPGFVEPFGGGIAVCAGPLSPVTKVIGAGFD